MKKLKETKEKLIKWDVSIYAALLIFTIPFFIFILDKFKLDNDFWFLINTGKYILNNGFPYTEPFTIHQDLFFIPQQWLTTIIFFLLYNKLGIYGILILELIINCIIIFLIYKLSYLINKNKFISVSITAIIDTIIVISSLTSRPQIFDILIFLSEILLLENFIFKNNYKYLLFLPLLSILLINLHASMWMILFIILIPYYIEYIIKKLKKENTFTIKPLIIITIISFLVGIINPYHINAISYLFKSYGVSEINNVIFEMQSLQMSKTPGIYLLIFIILILIYHNKGSNKIRYILLVLGFTYLTLLHYKGILFFLIASILILSDSLSNKTSTTKSYKLSQKEKAIYIILLIIIILVILSNIKISTYNHLDNIVKYLNENSNYNIKLYTGYDEGGYLEYKGYKCYIDPRAEVFLKSNNKRKDIFKEYYDLNRGALDAGEIIDNYKFDYILLKDVNYFLINEVSKNPKYEKVLEVSANEKNRGKYYLYKRVNEKNN